MRQHPGGSDLALPQLPNIPAVEGGQHNIKTSQYKAVRRRSPPATHSGRHRGKGECNYVNTLITSRIARSNMGVGLDRSLPLPRTHCHPLTATLTPLPLQCLVLLRNVHHCQQGVAGLLGANVMIFPSPPCPLGLSSSKRLHAACAL